MNPKDKRDLYIVGFILLISFTILLYLITAPFLTKDVMAESLKTEKIQLYGYNPLVSVIKARQPQKNVVSVEDKDDIEEFYAVVTGYSAIETCKGTNCHMSNGKKAYVGAAACPRRIPFGTLVSIDGIGVVRCEDHTALWTEGRFDVFFGYSQADYQAAKQWGKRTKLITINHSL